MFWQCFIKDEENANLPEALQPNVLEREPFIDFALTRNDFMEWLRVWRIIVQPDYVFNSDITVFANKTKSRFINLIENEIEEIGNIKLSFGFKVKFSIERLETAKYNIWNTISGKENHTYLADIIETTWNLNLMNLLTKSKVKLSSGGHVDLAGSLKE